MIVTSKRGFLKKENSIMYSYCSTAFEPSATGDGKNFFKGCAFETASAMMQLSPRQLKLKLCSGKKMKKGKKSLE